MPLALQLLWLDQTARLRTRIEEATGGLHRGELTQFGSAERGAHHAPTGARNYDNDKHNGEEEHVTTP